MAALYLQIVSSINLGADNECTSLSSKHSFGLNKFKYKVDEESKNKFALEIQSSSKYEYKVSFLLENFNKITIQKKEKQKLKVQAFPKLSNPKQSNTIQA
ncbi:MAG: hypothetical protein K8F60_05395 [Melioribacteraceae bacterium]|jgi:hypothetical protein|nr:hypothetical protein [Melioribacteraceae bacterium]